MKASWPKIQSIDDILIKSSEYLMETAHSFRLQLKQYLQGPKLSKHNQTAAPVEKPNTATIWVAKTLPSWQSIILTTLKEFHNVCIVFYYYKHILQINITERRFT